MSAPLPRTPSHAAPSSSNGDGGIMPSLYRLKVGPVNTAYYQGVFERFETLGKAAPMWNHGAAFFTLAWLLLRQLWRPAAIYSVLLAGCGAVWWAMHGRLPMALEAATVIGMALVLTVVPGLMGNALYYESVRRQTMQTLGEARNLSQAQLKLQENAVTKDRLHVVMAVQALVSAALLGVGMHQLDWAALRAPTPAVAASGPPTLHFPPSASPPLAAELQPQTPDQPLPADPSTPAAPLTATDTAPPPAPALAAAPANATLPDADTLSIVQLAQSIPPEPQSPAGPAAALASAAATSAAVAASVAAAPPAQSPPATPRAKPVAAAKDSSAKAQTKSAASAKAAKPAPANAAHARHALVPGKFYLNAGVYAQASNVQKAVRTLSNANLNVLQQTVSSNKGEMTRLRIGPFDTRAQAEAAAAKAKRLRYEVSVFQQPRR